MSKRNKNKKNKKTSKKKINNNFNIDYIFKKRKLYNQDNLNSNELFKYNMNIKPKFSNNTNEYYYENLKKAQEIQKKIKKEEKLNILITNKITNYKKIKINENDKNINELKNINEIKNINNNLINYDNSKKKIIINKKNYKNKIIQKNLNDYFK